MLKEIFAQIAHGPTVGEKFDGFLMLVLFAGAVTLGILALVLGIMSK